MRLCVAVVVCLVMAIGEDGTVAALLGRRRPPQAPSRAWIAVQPVKQVEAAPPALAPGSPIGRVAASGHKRRRHAAPAGDTAEFRCLQRAQVALASRDLSDALAALSEHTRRFPESWFSEEREAMRVRALEQSGRVLEAHRAAAAFRERFPRSALLLRLPDAEGAD